MRDTCMENILIETEPAVEFHDAHLLGNGTLGASVTGGIPYENILINHDTLWSGQERAKLTPDTRVYLEQARTMVLDERYHEATELINNEMLGYWSESYLPLGYLNLTVNLAEDRRTMRQKRILQNEFPYNNYTRCLDISRAVETIRYEMLGRSYTRQMFVSKPGDILAVRMESSDHELTFALSMDSPLRHEQSLRDDGAMVFGRAPDRVEPYGPRYTPNIVYREDACSDAIRFASISRVIDTDGEISRDEMRLYVRNASYAVIATAAETNFRGAGVPRDKDISILLAACEAKLLSAERMGWNVLMAEHVTDYATLYERVAFNFGPARTGHMTTSSRMRVAENVEDPALASLVAQYCRYLLIASSRPGSQAANLQGIWNPKIYPNWACNYTTNINVQMNYWCAESFALPECHMPMLDMTVECAQAGQAAAKALYGAGGWVTHHNTDLWRFTELAGEDASWAWWPFGGFWMAQHLWTHYEYTGDEDFLRNAVYPVLRGAAQFLCDFVVRDRKGRYVTAPSTSPENKFFVPGHFMAEYPEQVSAGNRMSPNRTDTAEVSAASTMDMAITREVFENFSQAATRLGEHDDLLERCAEILRDLVPYQIGKQGQLQEWEEDFEECTPGMSHLSHMYPVYPGQTITEQTPELFWAAQNALLRRERHGASETGWPGAWRMSLWARFRQADRANRLNGTMPRNLGANMLTRNSLQVDAVMGWGAGLAEMLLQSHRGRIDLLPAIPVSWRDGSVSGLRARGGYTVTITWGNGHLREVEIHADFDGSVILAYQDNTVTLDIKADQTISLDGTLCQK